MTLQEFKAWFEGFTEAMKGPPTAKAWGRIKQRVGEIDGVVTTERVFIERYWPTSPTYVGPWWVTTTGGTRFNTDTTINTAMYALGQADQASI